MQISHLTTAAAAMLLLPLGAVAQVTSGTVTSTSTVTLTKTVKLLNIATTSVTSTALNSTSYYPTATGGTVLSTGFAKATLTSSGSGTAAGATISPTIAPDSGAASLSGMSVVLAGAMGVVVAAML